MKKFVFSFLIVSSFNLYSQKNMKQDFFHGIELYTLNQKQMDKLLKEHKGSPDQELTALFKQKVFTLNDNRIIYVSDARTFLFNNKGDLIRFNEIIDSLARKEANPSFSLGENFIESVELYTETFENESGLSLNFADLGELKKVDSFINDLQKKGGNVQRYRVMLVAVIGEYIRRSIPNAVWTYLQDSQGGQTIAILDVDKSRIYGPQRIVEKELEYYLPKEGEVAFFDNVQIELIQYGVIKEIRK